MEANIPVAVSARHVHLTQATLDALFGPGHVLQVKSALSQPGQFAASETVTLVGPRGRLEHVRVLGPARSADQVELSRSDEMALGIRAPLRVSGDLAGTPAMVNEDAEGKAWFFKLKLANPAELDGLMDRAAYDAFVKEVS